MNNSVLTTQISSHNSSGSRLTAISGNSRKVRKTAEWELSLGKIAEYPEQCQPLAQQICERLLALIALVLTAPIMLVLAIIVRFDSPGPALFRQYRVGRGGRLFRFTKFRTYYADARDRFPHLYDYSIPKESLTDYRFKVPNDPRATRVGRWLRKSTLDELPNLWHVFTGEMALVGPRPEIPEFLPNYTREQLRMFSVTPGVTGLAQVSGRGWLTFPETCDLNLTYVDRRSLKFDLKILWLTVSRVILGHGAF